MAIDFPNSPSVGDTHEGFTYSTTGWTRTSSSGESSGGLTVYATPSNLPTSGNSDGDQGFVTSNKRLYIYSGSGWYAVALINASPVYTTSPNASYVLATDGTATTVTIVATDAEGLPITYTATPSGLGNMATVTGPTGAGNNVFTITPTTNTAYQGSFTVVFRATDGINNTDATSSFSITFLSPYWKDLKLSTGTSTTNALQNNTFIDKASSPATITSYGQSHQGTFGPYGDTWSAYLNGNDRFEATRNQIFTDGTADFTLEGWFMINGNNGQNSHGLLNWYVPNTGGAFTVRETSTDHTTFELSFWDYGNTNLEGAYNSTTAGYTGNGSGVLYSIGEWGHFALCYNATTDKMNMWLDGKWSSRWTFAGSLFRDRTHRIGDHDSYYPRFFIGYFSNWRLTRGTQRYTYTGTTVGNQTFTPSRDEPWAADANSDLFFNTYRHVISKGTTPTYENYSSVIDQPVIKKWSPFVSDLEYEVGTNYGSVLFDGNGDYLSAPSITLSGAYTVSGWAYVNNTLGDDAVFFSIHDATQSAGVMCYIDSSSNIRFYTNDGAQTNMPAIGSTIRPKEWFHWCFSRDSNNYLRIWLNGTEVNNSSVTQTNAASGILRIGAVYWNGSIMLYHDGYLSDVKITTTETTANFTPPTSPVGNTNASLYLPMDNAGIFDKTGNYNLLLNGDIASATSQYKFGSTSMRFDGVGDYIQLPVLNDIPAFKGNWTIETWIRRDSTSSDHGEIFASYSSTTTGLFVNVRTDGSINVSLSGDGADIQAPASTYANDTWFHLALVNNNGTHTLYIDGTSQGSFSGSVDYQSTQRSTIGTFWYYSNSTLYRTFKGWLSDFQILSIAKYTANFTPHTASFGRSNQGTGTGYA